MTYREAYEVVETVLENQTEYKFTEGAARRIALAACEAEAAGVPTIDALKRAATAEVNEAIVAKVLSGWPHMRAA